MFRQNELLKMLPERADGLCGRAKTLHDGPMYDPSMRVLTVLELLQTHGRLSGQQLAKTMEVSLRTVQRYVARLQDLGIPVASVRGPGGFYRLEPGFRLPPLMFGTEEAFALALGLDALAQLGLAELAPAAAGVQAKLARVLPVAVREQVEALRAALELSEPRWTVDTAPDTLMALASAVHRKQRVRLEYSKPNANSEIKAETGPSTRVIEPLGIVQQDGKWFLAAYCLLRRDLRLFRIDRVQHVQLLTETFTPPDAFDLHAFIAGTMPFAPTPWQVDVWLERPVEHVRRYLPRARAVLSDERNGTRLRCGVADLEDFAVLLLHLGGRLEVTSPPELFAAFGSVANRARSVRLTAMNEIAPS